MRKINFLKKLANTPPCGFRGASRVLGLVLVLLTLGVGNVWSETITFDFEENSAHRTSGNNSYTGSNEYEENGVTITGTYTDVVTNNGRLSGSADAMGRIAKNTTNSPILIIGPIDLDGATITGISYNVKGKEEMAQVCAYSTNGTSWTSAISISANSMPTSKTSKSVSNLSVVGTSNFYVKFTTSVSSSDKSNRDVQIDDVVITYTPAGPSNPTISTAVNPASSGTVVIKDNGNNTIASGSEFSEGDEFTLTATPNSGYKFAYWSLSTGSDAILNNADENPTSIMMIEESTTVTANFAQPATVGDASNISCTGASFAVSNSANRNNYIVYTTSNTATPSGTWSSLRNGNGLITISSLTKNTTYYYWCASEVASGHYVYTDKKNFTTANNFDLVLTLADGKGNTASAPSYTCIASGTSVTLTASPASGYVVSGWTVLDGSSNEITPTATTATTFTFNMPTSNVTAEAIFQQQVVAPTFSPMAGTYGSAQSVAISTTTPNATIYYTIGTNPAAPTTGSTPYTSAISVSSNQTIKAIAVKDGMANSAVSTATYTIKCATPVISLTAGTYTGAQSVTINVPSGATVYYTTDNSDPASSGTRVEYTGAFSVSASQTIKAIAIKDGMANSDLASAAYTIQYTITWYDNGGQIGDAVLVNSGSTTYTCPADPSPATRGNCGDRFMGWTDANYSGDEAPTVLFTNTSGTKPAINGNKNFRAVFADYAN